MAKPPLDPSEQFTVLAAAKLIGVNYRTLYRCIDAGEIATVPGKSANGRAIKMLRRGDLERVAGKKLAEPAAKPSSSFREQALPFDPGWIAAHMRARDLAWCRHLLAHNISAPDLPLPPEVLPSLKGQQIYSLPDVVTLIAQAIAKRDESWNFWICDSHERAAHPLGPLVGSLDFEPGPKE